MPLARADLESLLRTRQLDRTLTTAVPPVDPQDEHAVAPTGVAALDTRLGGGFPRGQLSELVGPRSSGRASLLLQALAAATARGELVALIDALDMLDVASAAAAGVVLERVLWVRGHVVVHPGLCRDSNQRAMDQALKALTLVLQAGNFGLVAFDAAEAPLDAWRRVPFTTWLRLQRMIEGRQTVCLLVGCAPMARSAAGLTVALGPISHAAGMPGRIEPAGPRPTAAAAGLGAADTAAPRAVTARIVRARARAREETTAVVGLEASPHV